MKFILNTLLILFLVPVSFAQTQNPLIAKNKADQKKWVDSIYKNMTLEEKVG